MKCRHCSTATNQTFLDLGWAPPSNSYISDNKLLAPEVWFPLRIHVCSNCWLVQAEDYSRNDELFTSDYAYFSSFSTSWLAHCETFSNRMISRFELNKKSMVCEVAANDGYLLDYFVESDIPCYGVEPTASTARVAREKGLEIVEEFFGRDLAKRLVDAGKSADLTAAKNVLAHVPDINDFVGGFSILLKPDGVATFEFPHLAKMVEFKQFDTAYHEHFSYLSLTALNSIFPKNGMTIFDVEEIPTHGGSLRVFAQRTDSGKREVSQAVASLLSSEFKAGVSTKEFYKRLQIEAEKIKYDVLTFLIDTKIRGKKVGAYGAAAKGNTMMNFAGIRTDLLPYVIDKNPAKQSQFMPGSHIPIVDETVLKREKPDYIVILPWNLKDEIASQLDYVREWGARFVTFIPELKQF